MRHRHRCFPVNFVKYLRTSFFIKHHRWLLLQRSEACNFIKKETPTQVFFCEFGEILKKNFLQITSGGLLLHSVTCQKENTLKHEKQPSRGVLRKSCSDKMHQIYRIRPMPKCDFNKVALQLYWNHISATVFPCKFAAYFQKSPS